MRQRSWRIVPITPRKFYHRVHMDRAVGDNDVMRWIAVLAGIAVPGCFDSQLNYCENGSICPESLACTERTPTVCAAPVDVEPCRAKADHTTCTSTPTPMGTCVSGVCLPCTIDRIECRYTEWTPMTSPTVQNLGALWVVADNDVYAVGVGVVLHYDGLAWSALPAPMTSFGLNAVWASTADEVVAVAQDGVVFLWRDGAWQTITPSAQVALFGIWGASLAELFVVGEMGAILRYDGTTWTPMTSNTQRTLYAVAGASASNLVAAGAAGTVQQYKGASWQAASGTPLTGVTVRGVWTSGTKVIAVGSEGTMGVIKTQDSAGWTTQASSTSSLLGVWGSADANAFAVGSTGVIEHYDGARWTSMSSGTTNALQAVAGTADNVFAVGDTGTILRYSPE